MRDEIVDAKFDHTSVAHHITQPGAHFPALDAVHNDREALEVKQILIRVRSVGLRERNLLVELVERAHIRDEVGDERAHLGLVAEAQERDETHKRLH